MLSDDHASNLTIDINKTEYTNSFSLRNTFVITNKCGMLYTKIEWRIVVDIKLID
jgi:hypothetical protein